MTKEQKIIRAKVGLLELAKQLGNVSQACKMLGYSRDVIASVMGGWESSPPNDHLAAGTMLPSVVGTGPPHHAVR